MSKTALVTGGNRGIGLAICKGLVAKGYSVLLGSREWKAGQAAAAEISGDVTAVQLDLGSQETTKKQIAIIMNNHPAIDILINNAGILMHGDALQVSDKEFYDSLQINFLAPFELCRKLLPGMIERNFGRIVNLSSGWGAFDEGLGGPAAYATTKAALNAMTVKFAQAVPQAVKINAMCPGWVKTRMGGEGASRTPEKGAETAIWLAELPANGPSGGFFRDKKRIAW